MQGGAHAGSRRDVESLLEEHFFERGQEEQHMLRLAGVTHQADTPNFSAERADAAGDLDAKFIEQLAAQARIDNARRHADAGNGREAVLRIGDE